MSSSTAADDWVEVNGEAGSARLSLDATLYPLPAIYGACHVFLDRCWLVVERPTAERFAIELTPKGESVDEGSLRATAGELANELLSCAYRHRLTQSNRAVIEAITTQAIVGAMGPASLEELSSFDFTEEPLEDPLGIAQPWEEKYAAGGGGATEGDPAAGDEEEGA